VEHRIVAGTEAGPGTVVEAVEGSLAGLGLPLPYLLHSSLQLLRD